MSRDPEVAKRVRILHVYPGFLKEALEKEKTEPLLQRSLRYRLTDLANHLREQKIFPKRHKFRLIRTFWKTEDVIRVMLDVLGGLPNVTDYFLMWCGLPAVGITAVPFLTAVPQPNLRKLSLESSLENVQSLLPATFHSPSLEELHLCIRSKSIRSLVERSQIMQETAINQINSTVKTLVIQSWEPTDLSPLFHTIGHMPALEDLSLCIPVENWHLGDPHGVHDFLNQHRTSLKSLRLRATQFGGIGLTPDLTSLHDWIKDVVRSVKLTKLRALDVSSNLFPVDTSVICVHRFSRTITSLSLTGGYRSYDDVERAVNLVADQDREESLGKLRIGLVSLSPQLMDLIASKLPHLFRLELLVRDIVPFATYQPTYYAAGQRASQIVSSVRCKLGILTASMHRIVSWLRWKPGDIDFGVCVICQSWLRPFPLERSTSLFLSKHSFDAYHPS